MDKFDLKKYLVESKATIQSRLSEASTTDKFLRKLFWDPDRTPQELATQIKNLSDEALLKWAEGGKEFFGKGIPNTPLAFQQKLVKIEMDKRGLSLDEN
jgi:hypothetical protein